MKPNTSYGSRTISTWRSRRGRLPRDLWDEFARRETQKKGDSPLFLWTPDGLRVAFWSNGLEGRSLAWTAADGSETAKPLGMGETGVLPGSWSPDGRVITYIDGGQRDIWLLDVGEDTSRPLMDEPFIEESPMISPDGRWIAYASDESGRSEIYLRSFPDLGTKFGVSTDGGTRPRWPASGRELFYWSSDRVMVADIGSDGAPTGRPRVLFRVGEASRFLDNPAFDGYDVAPDGEHFVILEEVEPNPAPTRLNLVLGFARELEDRFTSPR